MVEIFDPENILMKAAEELRKEMISTSEYGIVDVVGGSPIYVRLKSNINDDVIKKEKYINNGT